jgi:hypothetical protein
MERRGAIVRFTAALGLVFALAAAALPIAGTPALAQDDNELASITIYTAICPVGYEGDDLFGDCYDTPGADIPYLLTGPSSPEPVTNTTGADGFTAFEGIDEAGVYDLQIDVPGDAADFVAFCSDEFGEPFASTSSTEIGLVELDLTLDDDLRCDFYVIPEDLRGETPTAQPTPGTTLPNTGSGTTGSPTGGTTWPLVGALTLLVVAAAAFAASRRRLVPASVSRGR